MKYLVVLLLFCFSCSGKNAKPDNAAIEGGLDCTSAQTMKLITFCASPHAAETAARNLEIKDAARFEEAFTPLPVGSSPFLGPQDALVTIVMFSDLQCPFCRQAHEQLARIAETRDVKIVFKHAPLPFHEDAVPASLAALAARDQDKFWEYAKLAYENQEALKSNHLRTYAEQVGLDVPTFEQAFGSDSHLEAIQNDINLARNAGVEATPTVFINGLRVVGLYPEDQMTAMIDQQLEYAQKLLDAGVAREDVHWRLVSVNYAEPEVVAQEPEPEPQTIVAMVPIVDAPSKGADAEKALVTIVEFSDFQCSYCRKANLWLDAYMKKHNEDTRLVYRHFPLPFHEHADIAAAASIAAQQKGKFWEYHDLLFENQDNLTGDDLIAYAKKIKLPRSAFKKLQKSDAVLSHLKSDIELAQALGVQGTPTLFVNGVMFVGVPVDETLPNLIEAQRALAKKIAAETGLTGDALYEAVVKANQDAN